MLHLPCIVIILVCMSDVALGVKCPDVSPCTCMVWPVENATSLYIQCDEKLQLNEIPSNLTKQLADNKDPIFALYFSSNNISKLSDNSFAGLTFIGNEETNPLIKFTSNPVVEINPLAFANIKVADGYGLSLGLSSCGLTSFPAEAIMPMKTQLAELDLSFNEITQINSEKINETLSLQILNLNGNEIQIIENGTFKYFSKLQHLKLSNNRISEIERDAFTPDGSTEMNLTELYLGSNNLGKIYAGTFRYCSNLERLDVSSNKLVYEAGFIGESFQGLNLKSIDFHDNVLQRFPSEALQDMEKLDNIIVYNSQIRTLHNNLFHLWKATTQRMRIDLHNSTIEDIEEDALSSSNTSLRLNYLGLHKNKLRSFTFLTDPCSKVILNPAKWDAEAQNEPFTKVALGDDVHCECTLNNVIRSSMYYVSGTCKDDVAAYNDKTMYIFGDIWRNTESKFRLYHGFQKNLERNLGCFNGTNIECTDYAECSKAIPDSYKGAYKCNGASFVPISLSVLITCIITVVRNIHM